MIEKMGNSRLRYYLFPILIVSSLAVLVALDYCHFSSEGVEPSFGASNEALQDGKQLDRPASAIHDDTDCDLNASGRTSIPIPPAPREDSILVTVVSTTSGRPIGDANLAILPESLAIQRIRGSLHRGSLGSLPVLKQYHGTGVFVVPLPGDGKANTDIVVSAAGYESQLLTLPVKTKKHQVALNPTAHVVFRFEGPKKVVDHIGLHAYPYTEVGRVFTNECVLVGRHYDCSSVAGPVHKKNIQSGAVVSGFVHGVLYKAFFQHQASSRERCATVVFRPPCEVTVRVERRAGIRVKLDRLPPAYGEVIAWKDNAYLTKRKEIDSFGEAWIAYEELGGGVWWVSAAGLGWCAARDIAVRVDPAEETKVIALQLETERSLVLTLTGPGRPRKTHDADVFFVDQNGGFQKLNYNNSPARQGKSAGEYVGQALSLGSKVLIRDLPFYPMDLVVVVAEHSAYEVVRVKHMYDSQPVYCRLPRRASVSTIGRICEIAYKKYGPGVWVGIEQELRAGPGGNVWVTLRARGIQNGRELLTRNDPSTWKLKVHPGTHLRIAIRGRNGEQEYHAIAPSDVTLEQ